MLRGWSAGVRIRNHVADSKWDDEEMLLLQSLIADELKTYEISDVKYSFTVITVLVFCCNTTLFYNTIWL